MWVYYILDEGLPIEMQTGESPSGRLYDTVAHMQSAIKFLVKNKDVAACKIQDIEIYPLGVTKADYDKGGPTLKKKLRPEDKLPTGSTRENAIFVHVPREKQQLTPEERRIYSSPKPTTKPKVQMARPEIDKLIISPKRKIRTKPRKMIEVTVRCLHNGNEFQKMIDAKNTVSQLKELFAEPSGVSASNQTLYFQGTELEDDSQTATESGIQHQSVIALEPKTIQVHVRTPDGKNIPVTMKQSDTVQFIKEKVAPESGVEVPQQILKYHGKILSDNHKTARDSNLEDGAIIDLLPNPIEIIVRTPDGTTIPVSTKPTDRIRVLKETVAPKTGIEVPHQILQFHGTTLPDHETVHDMGLQDGSVVDLSTAVQKEPKQKKEKAKEDNVDDWDCKYKVAGKCLHGMLPLTDSSHMTASCRCLQCQTIRRRTTILTLLRRHLI